MKFDIQSYFESRSIEFFTSGKNVTQGWTNINCPFCEGSDPSNHCGISPHDFFNCYICGETGHVVKLIRKLEGCTFLKAQRIFDSFQHEDFFEEEIRKDVIKTSLPKECSSKFPKNYLNYLKKRRFDPNYLITKYNLKCCHNIGKYKFRIIIPFYFNDQLVTFSSLDITGKQEIKYKHQPKEEAIIPVKGSLFNIDSCKNKMVLVEGITDVWRIGDETTAIIGKQITSEQINQIVRKDIKKVLVILDSDAVEQGEKMAKQLSGIISSVEYISLEKGDPCDFDDNEVREVRKFLK
jgi:DNA primase